MRAALSHLKNRAIGPLGVALEAGLAGAGLGRPATLLLHLLEQLRRVCDAYEGCRAALARFALEPP